MPSHSPTTQELLKRAQDLIHLDQDYLKDFNAAIDQLQKKKEEFQAEHPPFGFAIPSPIESAIRANLRARQRDVGTEHGAADSRIGDGLTSSRYARGFAFST